MNHGEEVEEKNGYGQINDPHIQEKMDTGAEATPVSVSRISHSSLTVAQ